MLKSIFTKKIIWVILVVAVLVGSYFGYQKFFVKKELPYSWVLASYGDISEVVSETGTVKAAEEINLSFKNGGVVKEIKVNVGDSVLAGTELMSLDTAEIELKVREAQSAYNAALAKLRSILTGAISEDIKVYETAVRNAEENLENLKKNAVVEIANAEKSLDTAKQAVINAQVALADAERNLSNVITNAENNLNNVYENARITMEGNLVAISTALGDADNILGIDDETANDVFEANLGVYNAQTKINAEASYREAKTAYDESVSTVSQISSTNQNSIDLALLKVRDALIKTDDALYKTRLLLDNSLVSNTLTLTDLNAKKVMINTDRQNINTNLSALETSKQTIESTKLTNQVNIDSAKAQVNVAKANLATAEKNKEAAEESLLLAKTSSQNKISAAEGELETARAQLALKKASPKEADIAYYQAEVARSKAQLEIVKKQLEDAILKAPIDGTITKVNFKVGETVQPQATAVSLISSNNFQIEADVSELDINKIKLNDIAQITFDAISPDKIFKGKVLTIDPTEKIKDGDIYYRIVILLDEKDVPIKSGMTADIDIITNQKTGVLLIPKRAVIREGKIRKVRILEANQIKTVEISLGLEGVDMVEVVSGLKEGDKVITFIKE